jgi:NAD(P)H dehydrogenase (quinone)
VQSTGSQGGGQESIGLTTVPFFAHHGMVFVPFAGAINPKFFNMEEVHGSSFYGPGAFAGADGSRQPSELELDLCESHGKNFATVAGKLSA